MSGDGAGAVLRESGWSGILPLMEYSMGIAAALFGLVLFSAFFSASETAFSTLNRIKLKNQEGRRAAMALKLADQYDKLLSAVLIGNNIVNIAASSLATVFFVGLLGSAGVSAATLVMTVILLFLGEISPKTLAKEAPERTAVLFAPLLNGLVIILAPLNRLMLLWKRVIIRLFRVQGNRRVTEAELLTFVEEARQDGGINEREETLIRRTIAFDDLCAQDIYTPRVDVSAVPADASVEEVERTFQDTGYSRLPVYEESIDHIIGLILLKDFYRSVITRARPPASIISIVTPVVFIAKSIKLPLLLKTLQDKQSHLAVLVDEFGGTMGIITIEDILEELVGEIWDEHDKVEEPIVQLEPDVYRVLGKAGAQDLFERFPLVPLEGAPDENGGKARHTTVSNWLIERCGKLPKEGEPILFKGFTLIPSKIHRNRILEITLRREESP
ncbi:MAG: hemolysin family protein [Spirochaetaceae bacterium]|jgi:CBS domain containing-hemolysin-like protein|nr:hemolysin family protein [Spirochaetaceae bacterium]